MAEVNAVIILDVFSNEIQRFENKRIAFDININDRAYFGRGEGVDERGIKFIVRVFAQGKHLVGRQNVKMILQKGLFNAVYCVERASAEDLVNYRKRSGDIGVIPDRGGNVLAV